MAQTKQKKENVNRVIEDSLRTNAVPAPQWGRDSFANGRKEGQRRL